MIKDYYTVRQFALLLDVSEKTIYQSIKKGRINAFRLGPSEKSPYRISHSELQRMALCSLRQIMQQIGE